MLSTSEEKEENRVFSRFYRQLKSEDPVVRSDAARNMSQLFFDTSSRKDLLRILLLVHPDKGFPGDSAWVQVVRGLLLELDPLKEHSKQAAKELTEFAKIARKSSWPISDGRAKYARQKEMVDTVVAAGLAAAALFQAYLSNLASGPQPPPPEDAPDESSSGPEPPTEHALEDLPILPTIPEPPNSLVPAPLPPSPTHHPPPTTYHHPPPPTTTHYQ